MMQVTRQWQTVQTATGPMQVLVFTPQARHPQAFAAVLFYSEIFQITEPIRRAATQLAGQGFIVLVPEVFHELNPIGTVLGYDDAGKDKGNQDKWCKPLPSYDSDNQALIDYLATRADWDGRLGAMGVCIGGHLAFRAALHPQVQAALCLYATDLHSDTLPDAGQGQTLALASRIRGELVMVWGRQDPHVPFAGRLQILQQLEAAGVYYSWHEVNAPHAFIRDEGERYDPALTHWVFALAQQLFQRMAPRPGSK